MEDLNKSLKELLTQEGSLQIEQIGDYRLNGRAPCSASHVSMKNQTSFLIATFKRGLKVIENGKEIFSKRCFSSDLWLLDIIYVPDLDSYFLCYDFKLYRKDIDDKDHYLFMDIKFGYRFGSCFKYTRMNRRMVLSQARPSRVQIVDLFRKRVCLKTVKNFGRKICDFDIFGKDENYLALFSYDGLVSVLRVDYKLNKILYFVQVKLDLKSTLKWFHPTRKLIPSDVCGICAEQTYPLLSSLPFCLSA